MYLRGRSISFHNGGRFSSDTIFSRNIKRYRHVIQSGNYKTWQKEKWQGRSWKRSIKFNIFLPLYYIAQTGEYSGQVMSKNKINMKSRNETKAKYSICRRLDNKLKIYVWNVPRKHQNQRGLIQGFAIVLTLLAKAIAIFFTQIYLEMLWFILHRKQTSNVLDSKTYLQLGAI